MRWLYTRYTAVEAGGCLDVDALCEENYIRNIAEVMVSSCDVIPVVSSEVFRFPTPEFYQELKPVQGVPSISLVGRLGQRNVACEELQRRASEVFADTTTHPNDIIDYVQQTFKTIALVLLQQCECRDCIGAFVRAGGIRVHLSCACSEHKHPRQRISDSDSNCKWTRTPILATQDSCELAQKRSHGMITSHD
eukprot:3916220-Amphidinium_carterae.1